jgi:hypothetical protein
MTGTVSILSCGEGHTKLSFDPDDEAERIRATRIVKDMLRRGYSLLVQVPGAEGAKPTYQRVYDFKEDTCEYIIADLDPTIAAVADQQEQETYGKRKPRTKTIPAGSSTVVAVPHRAGG